ncbi:MAG: hypothetical protein HY301_07590 [Verrucomicrobia bacterium]|nr:hypothetical protein [Verrucomicrobiota bacterium]
MTTTENGAKQITNGSSIGILVVVTILTFLAAIGASLYFGFAYGMSASGGTLVRPGKYLWLAIPCILIFAVSIRRFGPLAALIALLSVSSVFSFASFKMWKTERDPRDAREWGTVFRVIVVTAGGAILVSTVPIRSTPKNRSRTTHAARLR